ncbi:circadian clock protein KaiC [Longibacter salinarum]|uniref:non-specific serine/threonine protein kinase n=1 Tax=Longibacter salinarum TaxID=1850348 RepID=A0A2A8CWJ4_9BACT|nr:ATPase domain-containing protein [Longibacter salinarum]PEN12758.1 circadian clock protein KaiC [Longibacter salinarum]
MATPGASRRVPTGIEGLDAILRGGLPRGEVFLVQGTPGTGKTLLSIQFLRAGVENGESCLFISLSQSAEGLRRNVGGAGLSLEGIRVHDDLPVEAPGSVEQEQVIFHDEHVEFDETVRALTEAVERAEPDRVVFDGIGYLRLLVRSAAQYRRQLLALRRFFSSRDITVMLTDDQSVVPGEDVLQSLVYGALLLEQTRTNYGDTRRELHIVKLRGTDHASGTHEFRISTGGLKVFPRLRSHHVSSSEQNEALTSGIESLDNLLGGGLQEGTSCLILGPVGTGKTSLATLYADAAARRNHSSAVFLFDERPEIFVRRSEALGMPITQHVEEGRVSLHAVMSGEITPGEFAYSVSREVRERDVRVVIIDTLTGYLSAMPDQRHLITKIQDLLTYLSRQGVLTILVVAQHGVIGEQSQHQNQLRGPIDISYLADAILTTQHFEIDGALRRAVSVYKKRYGAHERRIRELFIEDGLIKVGAPMTEAVGTLLGHSLEAGTDASDDDT